MARTGERDIVVLHITDLHLFGDRDARLFGVATDRTLAAVLESAAGRCGRPDVLIATGDLSQDGAPDSYRRLNTVLERIGVPVLCLPGNHDEPGLMELHLTGGNVSTRRRLQIGGWQLIQLDSTVAGAVGGHLEPGELAALERALRERPDVYALVCLHHHPVPTGSRWMDGIALDNPEALFRVTEKFPNVRGIIWGHVHQEFRTRRNGVELMSTPSTCFQFKPGSPEFSLDDSPPGYRILRLGAEGQLESEVCRVRGCDSEADVAATGYS